MDKLLSFEEIFLAKKAELNQRIKSFYKDECANVKNFRAWIKSSPLEVLCATLSSDTELLVNVNQRGNSGDKTCAESTLKEDSVCPLNGMSLQKTIQPNESLAPTSNRPKRSAAVKAREKTFQYVNMPLSCKLRRPSNYLSMTTVTVPVKRKSSESLDKKPKKHKLDSNVPASPPKETTENEKTKLITVATPIVETPHADIETQVEIQVNYDVCVKHTTKQDNCNSCLSVAKKSLRVLLSPLPQNKVEKYSQKNAPEEKLVEASSVPEIESNNSPLKVDDMTTAKGENESQVPSVPTSVKNIETISLSETMDVNKTIVIADEASPKTDKLSPVVAHNDQGNATKVEVNNRTSPDIFSSTKINDVDVDDLPNKQCDATFEVSEAGRPKRAITKTRKLLELEQSQVINSSSVMPKKTRTKAKKSPESDAESETGELPESDTLCKKTEETLTKVDNAVFKVPLALDTLPLPKVEHVEEKPMRARTKTLKKAVNDNLPVVDIPERTTRTRSKMIQKTEKENGPSNDIPEDKIPELKTELNNEPEEQSTENEEPGVRTRTRTKVKERVQQLEEVIQSQVKAEAELPKTIKPSKIKVSPGDIGKENSVTKIPTSIEKYQHKGTPLANSNRIFSPLNYKILSSGDKLRFPIKVGDEETHMKRIEEAKKKQMKEEEALKKKNEMIKAQTEEIRRKREMKLKKVAAAREAEEREKLELRKKLAREKEEKERAARAEKEKLRETALLKKKLLNQQKAQEAEERRLKEEALRLAKQREIEEEQRKQAEYKLKMQQEAERLYQERMAEKAKEAKQLKEQLLEKAKLKIKHLQKDASYDMTPPRTERPILPPKNHNDYGIDDLNSSDSSEDEHHPKKKIPSWATKAARQLPLIDQFYIPSAIKSKFMVCPSRTPDLAAMFGENVGKRVRTSSAVWRTPPNLSILD